MPELRGAMRRLKRKALLCFAFCFLFVACVQSPKETQQYINAPVNLTISQAGTQTYQLSFQSDNREGGFAGYGVFTGSSADAVSQEPATDITAAQLFCSWGSQTYYAYPVNIQIGPAAAGIWAPPTSTSSAPNSNLLTLCTFTNNTISSGSYIALRARVERTTKPWSAAAVAAVP